MLQPGTYLLVPPHVGHLGFLGRPRLRDPGGGSAPGAAALILRNPPPDVLCGVRARRLQLCDGASRTTTGAHPALPKALS